MLEGVMCFQLIPNFYTSLDFTSVNFDRISIAANRIEIIGSNEKCDTKLPQIAVTAFVAYPIWETMSGLAEYHKKMFNFVFNQAGRETNFHSIYMRMQNRANYTIYTL